MSSFEQVPQPEFFWNPEREQVWGSLKSEIQEATMPVVIDEHFELSAQAWGDVVAKRQIDYMVDQATADIMRGINGLVGGETEQVPSDRVGRTALAYFSDGEVDPDSLWDYDPAVAEE